METTPASPSKAANAGRAPGKSFDRRLPTARTLGRFLTAAQSAIKLRGQVSVLLTSDQTIRSLNRRFRGKNKATDVLSFPADESAPGVEPIAGDLAISVPTATRQAAEQGHSLSTEIKVLILHGLLHLAGYDHEVDSGQMARRERLLRGRLRLPQGLIERAAVAPPPLEKKRKNAAKSAAGKPVSKPKARKTRSAGERI